MVALTWSTEHKKLLKRCKVRAAFSPVMYQFVQIITICKGWTEHRRIFKRHCSSIFALITWLTVTLPGVCGGEIVGDKFTCCSALNAFFFFFATGFKITPGNRQNYHSLKNQLSFSCTGEHSEFVLGVPLTRTRLKSRRPVVIGHSCSLDPQTGTSDGGEGQCVTRSTKGARVST